MAGGLTGRPSRRQILTAAGVAGAGLLAGCTTASGSRPIPDPSSADVTSSAPTPPTTPPPTPSTPTAPTSSAAPKPSYDTLSRQLTRPLLRPGSGSYSSAARLYSPRFDAAHPAAVAPCTTAADVAHCIRFAADAGVPFALRAGGHSYGGWSTTSGLQIDTTAMDAVRVDRSARTATIGAGARLVDVYTALGDAGLALAAGSCPTVGLTGLALGGGVGVLARAYGLTCDALASAQIVTADGNTRTVDARHEPDLFWALRGGGGGNFAAVTALTFALQPAPNVQTFFYSFPFSRAAQVLGAWQSWLPTTDNDLWSTCKLLADPGNGGAMVSVSGTWIGNSSQLTSQLAPLLSRTGPPSSTNTTSLNYTQAMLLEAGCSGQTAANCTSSALSSSQRLPFAATSSIVTRALTPTAISTVLTQVQKALSVSGLKEGGVSFDALGGAVSRPGATATPFPYRSALASVQYTATWTDWHTSGAPFDAYVRGFRAAMRPWLGTAAYVNYADASISDYGPAYWGSNYRRLQAVKKQYDPHSLFTFPQAVKPA